MNNLINPILFNQDIEEEKWSIITDVIVPNIQPWYYISTYGRIYSIKTNKYLSQSICTWGYKIISLCCTHKQRSTHKVHRLVMLVFKYIPNHNNMQINHINGIKIDNNIYNLEWCNNSENIQHAIANNLMVYPIGEDVPNASITNIQAEQIAKLISLGKYEYREIADMIGCTEGVVNRIGGGYTWKKYYEMYDLHQIKPKLAFSDEQVHYICKCFETYIGKYTSNKTMFEGILNEIGMIYDGSKHSTMYRILTKKSHHTITSQYNY